VTHFRHFYKLPTSQPKPTARHTVRALAHTQTQASLLWPQPAGPPAQPGMRPVLWRMSHASLRIIAHRHVRVLMTRGYVDDSLLRQAVESSLAIPGIEAVVVDAC